MLELIRDDKKSEFWNPIDREESPKIVILGKSLETSLKSEPKNLDKNLYFITGEKVQFIS